MEIRHIEDRDDVRGVVRAHGLAWREAYDEILPDEVLESQPIDPTGTDVERWVDALAETEAGVLIAVEGGAVRGFVDLRWGDAETKAFVGDDDAELKAIYVHPDCWGEGIGTALLERGLEVVPDLIEVVRLEVFVANDDARKFYEKRGFEHTDTGEIEIGDGSYGTAIYTLVL
ncbi:GNAT family N-acetyltransferase [Natronobacterium gregoryi]|uniref:Acetyltransferase n=2 Tax=Natronobacterium gregoryi TaxID=44930 RepID=L0AGE0_NATGS|nr:GNAT family N-acetyltransferase [Natronobacterium gregoryi]AFZ72891.1 acetyltransferase [Natronobacterium gregoryi SP2]ELY69682.1 N-acetyltransferase GCN5 [Natronobacterium gregoryi SP2]PLK21881.1 N-acetyltransferase [Natronobacterium gregoryi SP2]SFI66617.1 Ribosomal protein S18 acetylase RimI [Natronobacterium gregoryi]